MCNQATAHWLRMAALTALMGLRATLVVSYTVIYFYILTCSRIYINI